MVSLRGLLGGTIENVVGGNKINASLKICFLFIFWSSSFYFLHGTIIINIPILAKKNKNSSQTK